MEKLFIKSREGRKIAVIIEKTENPAGLAFIMHGLGDSKNSPHIELFARCFRENNYSVVRFDARNTNGESEGKFEDADVGNYFTDLEDVIAWAKQRDFYQEPFILCGHSLGGMCSAFYAENYPREVKALAQISTTINAALSRENYSAAELKNWEKTGWLAEDWDGEIIRLKWSYMQAKENFDLLPRAGKLTMPVVLIVGEFDKGTPPAHQRILFDKLPGPKEIHIIKGAPHTFREREHLDEVYRILDEWIKKI